MARKTRNATPQKPFNEKLILNQYMLSLFGVRDFKTIAEVVNQPDNEGMAEDNLSRFHHVIANNAALNSGISIESLQEYDRNIARHTEAIQGKRSDRVQWKYFQYLGLLFTEIFLDRYFNRQEELLAGLNKYVVEFNSRVSKADEAKRYSKDDLRRIAFWCATGSGKTLIMHINIKQFMHYLEKAGRGKDINRVLLITPNEGLSRQHLEEMRLSGIHAEIFDKNAPSMFKGRAVEIIEITKLDASDGEKRVAVDSFGNDNFVLIDEGHRGATGDKWGENRRKLAKDGFAIEYSATLGQAAAKKKELAVSYGKSIIFDYSYRHFYGDGYGKDYRIYNLPDDEQNSELRALYLTACMLAFYQQKLLFQDKEAKAGGFNIENPLCIFVGSSVNAVRTVKEKTGGKTKEKMVSDVVEILQFLAHFTASANKKQVLERIKKVKSGSAALIDAARQPIFTNAFLHLVNLDAEEIYGDLLRRVFNADTGGSFHIEELKGADGEIALRLGNHSDFGIINVGDAPKLCKLCAEHYEFEVSARNFTGSLFHGINAPKSDLNILIGSKRFTEGWNSWRVGTMAMMNVGRGEGAQVIQLFGRGVRLKGYEKSLKRHSHESMLTQYNLAHNKKLATLETLNIFGVRADYMEQFKKYLETEGVPTPGSVVEITVPVEKQLKNRKLKTIKVKSGLNFRKNGGKHRLRLSKELHTNKIVLDFYPRIESIEASGVAVASTAIKEHSTCLGAMHLALLDYDDLYFDLQRLKKDRKWFNLCISKEAIKSILARNGEWCEVLIPAEQMKLNKYGDIAFWQNMASSLIQRYCDQFYNACHANWEKDYRKYVNLEAKDRNFPDEYKIRINKDQAQLIAEIQNIKSQIAAGTFNEDKEFGQNVAIAFDRHLYKPLVFLGNKDLTVQPVGLNSGEKKFVEALRHYHSTHPEEFKGKELYLLRNMSRGRGVGFFEAGKFYPDFILWLVEGDVQTINFIDPKGMRNLPKNHPKLNFYKTIKDIEKQMGDAKVMLNSFIISTTAFAEMRVNFGGVDRSYFDGRNIFFQKEPGYIGKMFAKIL